MIFFTPSELARIAMKIEQNGLSFYKAMAERTEDSEAKALFSFMALEEEAHFATFKKLLTKFEAYEIPGVYEEEEDYDAYMADLVDNNVFAKDIDPVKLAGSIKTPVEAINLAIGFEKDTIIFFLHFKDIVPQEEKFVFRELIAEENKHIKKLVTVKKTITSTAEDYYTSQKTGDAEK